MRLTTILIAMFNMCFLGVYANTLPGESIKMEFESGSSFDNYTVIPQGLVTVRIISNLKNIDSVMIFDINRENGKCGAEAVHPRVFYIKFSHLKDKMDFIANIHKPCIDKENGVGFYKLIVKTNTQDKLINHRIYKVKVHREE